MVPELAALKSLAVPARAEVVGPGRQRRHSTRAPKRTDVEMVAPTLPKEIVSHGIMTMMRVSRASASPDPPFGAYGGGTDLRVICRSSVKGLFLGRLKL